MAFSIDFVYIVCYIIHMKNKYKHTKTTVSLINYHIVFCPRYRRKIFNIPGVEERWRIVVPDEKGKYLKETDDEIFAMQAKSPYKNKVN